MGQKVNPLGFRLGVSQKHISHWFVEKNNYSQLVVEDQFIRNFFYKNFPGIASIHIKRDLNRVVIEILSSNTRDLLMEGGKITAKATSLPAQTKNGTSASTSQGARSSGNNQIDSLCDQLLNALTAFRKTQSQTTLLKKRSFKSGSIQDSASQGEINGVPSTPSSITDNENQNLTKEQPTLEPNRATSSSMTELGPKQTSSLVDKPVEVELFLTKVENPSTSAACLAEFIVEQLEKRIPFRRVLKRSIQKAEESSVAGIKVQISGRLNGAEIARSERIHKGQVPLHTLRAKIEYNSRTAKTIYGLLGVKVWVFNGFADLNETKVLNKN